MSEAKHVYKYTVEFFSPVGIGKDLIREQIEEYFRDEVIPLEEEEWGLSVSDISVEQVK